MPSYEQRQYGAEEKAGKLRLVASPDGAEGSVTIHTDAKLYATVLQAGQTVEHLLAPGRHAWVHVARGEAKVNGQALGAGDGASLSEETKVTLAGLADAEVLLFDLG